MDDRTTQIREGAGQVESKLNTEFIDWLRKWHMPILLVVAMIALSYVGYQRWQQMKSAKVARAFSEYWNTSSPEALRSVAVTHEGVRAVSELARLGAADTYLKAARTGIKPGAQPGQGGVFAPADVMNESDREAILAEAESLYREVLTTTRDDQPRAIHALNASYGLAAVAESRGDLGAARGHYEEVARLAEWAGYPQHAEIANRRIERLPRLAEAPRLYAQAELPKAPEPPAPDPAAAMGLFDPSGIRFDPGVGLPELPPQGEPEPERPGVEPVPSAPPG
jgi:hypothetical protein